MHVFLSHNHRDKDIATLLAAQLRLVGADVWLDDWEIKPGDSIVGKGQRGLRLDRHRASAVVGECCRFPMGEQRDGGSRCEAAI